MSLKRSKTVVRITNQSRINLIKINYQIPTGYYTNGHPTVITLLLIHKFLPTNGRPERSRSDKKLFLVMFSTSNLIMTGFTRGIVLVDPYP